MPLNAQLAVTVSSLLTAVQDLGESKNSASRNYAYSLADGAGAGQANRIFHDQRTLAASATEDLDLAGVLIDPLGATLTFARIKGIIVAAATGNTNEVVVGGAAATQFVSPFGSATDKVKVRPGGVLALFAGQADAVGYVTAAGSTDLLRIGNGGAGTAVTYDIILIGAAS